MGAPQVLWRRVLVSTMKTLRGESTGQYDIRLGRSAAVERFFEGVPREYDGRRGGFSVQVPIAATAQPDAVEARTIKVSNVGAQAKRGDWRIPSQRPTTAYPLWRYGTGLTEATVPGEDFVLLVRDARDRFHARWLRGGDVARLPQAVTAKLTGSRDIGVETLSGEDWVVAADVLGIAEDETEPPAGEATRVRVPYRREDENVSTAKAQPFAVDPDVVDRGTAAHRETQNALADYLKWTGRTPESHDQEVDPEFDLAWEESGVYYVAEVKSLTAKNEEKQLRLALGQVLRYAHRLGAGGRQVVPVIVVEREPADASWAELCASRGVRLAWPGAFDAAIGPVA